MVGTASSDGNSGLAGRVRNKAHLEKRLSGALLWQGPEVPSSLSGLQPRPGVRGRPPYLAWLSPGGSGGWACAGSMGGTWGCRLRPGGRGSRGEAGPCSEPSSQASRSAGLTGLSQPLCVHSWPLLPSHPPLPCGHYSGEWRCPLTHPSPVLVPLGPGSPSRVLVPGVPSGNQAHRGPSHRQAERRGSGNQGSRVPVPALPFGQVTRHLSLPGL